MFERIESTECHRLCESIMLREDLDAAGAARQIDADVEAIVAEGACSGEVSLGPMGTLVVDGDGSISFVQSASFVDYSGGAWLRPLKLRELAADTDATSAPVPASSAPVGRTWLRWAATTAAAMIVFAVVTLVTVFANRFIGPAESGSPLTAGIMPSASPAVGMVEEAPVGAHGSLVLILNTPSDGSAPVEPRPAPASLVPDAYCLVVASLATEAEAMAFCEAHSTTSMPLGVLPVDGRYRIYAASAPTMPEVLAIAAERGIADVYATAWVCRN